MAATEAAGVAWADEMPARVFRGLYGNDWELHSIGNDAHFAVPAGTVVFSGRSLGEVARKIGDHGPGDRSGQEAAGIVT
jgi:hypothetical protein